MLVKLGEGVFLAQPHIWSISYLLIGLLSEISHVTSTLSVQITLWFSVNVFCLVSSFLERFVPTQCPCVQIYCYSLSSSIVPTPLIIMLAVDQHTPTLNRDKTIQKDWNGQNISTLKPRIWGSILSFLLFFSCKRTNQSLRKECARVFLHWKILKCSLFP